MPVVPESCLGHSLSLFLTSTCSASGLGACEASARRTCSRLSMPELDGSPMTCRVGGWGREGARARVRATFFPWRERMPHSRSWEGGGGISLARLSSPRTKMESLKLLFRGAPRVRNVTALATADGPAAAASGSADVTTTGTSGLPVPAPLSRHCSPAPGRRAAAMRTRTSPSTMARAAPAAARAAAAAVRVEGVPAKAPEPPPERVRARVCFRGVSSTPPPAAVGPSVIRNAGQARDRRGHTSPLGWGGGGGGEGKWGGGVSLSPDSNGRNGKGGGGGARRARFRSLFSTLSSHTRLCSLPPPSLPARLLLRLVQHV